MQLCKNTAELNTLLFFLSAYLSMVKEHIRYSKGKQQYFALHKYYIFVTKLAKVFNNSLKKPQTNKTTQTPQREHNTVEMKVLRFRELSTKMSVVSLPGGNCLSHSILNKSHLTQ